MNIFVCIKQVPDTETKINPNNDKSYIEKTSIKWIVNPYDEFAIEQALLVKNEINESNVTAIRVGSEKDVEALRTAMAMGVDESILVEAEDNIDSYTTAKAIVKAIEKIGKKPDIIFAGKQAIDDDCSQVPQLIAQILNIPSVSVVVDFSINGEEIVLKREIEGGTLEVYKVKAPIVISCNKGLNTPRYASLPGIMKAKKKPLTKYSIDELGITKDDQKIKNYSFQLPPEKPAGKKFDATDESKQEEVVKEVINLLRNEAKII